LAILVLRIGGPRLFWTFNKLNYLPSASLMYCKLKNKLKINTSITCSIEQQVEENIQQFFQCRHGEYSCKIDEVSTAERVSFNPATNEFDGLCRNYIDTTIDYKVFF